MNLDKELERQRYDAIANEILLSCTKETDFIWTQANQSLESIPCYLKAPYIAYLEQLEEVLSDGAVVLELGAGTGAFTAPLLRGNATVWATDISAASIEVYSGSGF